MKKILLTALLSISFLGACGKKDNTDKKNKTESAIVNALKNSKWTKKETKATDGEVIISINNEANMLTYEKGKASKFSKPGCSDGAFEIIKKDENNYELNATNCIFINGQKMQYTMAVVKIVDNNLTFSTKNATSFVNSEVISHVFYEFERLN